MHVTHYLDNSVDNNDVWVIILMSV